MEVVDRVVMVDEERGISCDAIQFRVWKMRVWSVVLGRVEAKVARVVGRVTVSPTVLVLRKGVVNEVARRNIMNRSYPG